MLAETVSSEQWNTFFNTISRAYSVSEALRRANISRATAYRWKKRDKWIAQRWAEAEEAALHFLEDTARNRAVTGVKHIKRSYDDNGKVLDEEIKYITSDRLLERLLAARDARYRSGSSEQVMAQVTRELARIFDILAQRLPQSAYQMVLEVLAKEADIIDVSIPEDSDGTVGSLEDSETTPTDISRRSTNDPTIP